MKILQQLFRCRFKNFLSLKIAFSEKKPFLRLKRPFCAERHLSDRETAWYLDHLITKNNLSGTKLCTHSMKVSSIQKYI